MNSVQLVGRFTKDPKVSVTNGGTSIAKFTLAVDRVYKSETQTADFIPCTAFGKTAEFIEKYFSKGNRIGITGRMQSGSYEKDGQTIFTLDVAVENCEFVESKKSSNNEGGYIPDLD